MNNTKKINKVLVANRGEIALRIMRSLKEINIQTVAIYTEIDRTLPFVVFADEAVCIGENMAKDSYLNAQKIIDVCKNLHIDAVHPGYGFLSENPDFANLLQKNNLILIGPNVDSIRIMGNKLLAKEAVKKFAVPLIPGSEGAIEKLEEAIVLANKIGFPLMLKAAAGGGGKGMRIVRDENELSSGFQSAVNEAKNAFGDGSVFLEKYIENPKHIEFQILADSYGQTVYLFERDCSIQRRHQKVIEEAPSLYLSEKLREEMGECAVNVAKSCAYLGAGTVEFIMDENKKFYFLEMNTRLQVEHPITECITGLDLVKEQVKIAQGEKLSFQQKDLQINGHAIECRVYAENTENGFLPDIGTITRYQKPTGPGVRLDDGYKQGSEISMFYDPMISKLIVHAENRDQALIKLKNAINDYIIEGVETTLSFCNFVLEHPLFKSGNYYTNFVEKYYQSTENHKITDKEIEKVAAIFAAFYVEQEVQNLKPSVSSNSDNISNWKKRRT